jgi:mRNA interferase HigB
MAIAGSMYGDCRQLGCWLYPIVGDGCCRNLPALAQGCLAVLGNRAQHNLLPPAQPKLQPNTVRDSGPVPPWMVLVDTVTILVTIDILQMRIITRQFLEKEKKSYANARAPLDHWHRLTKAARWANFVETRKTFPHADQVTVASKRTVTVFNITNEFRLITAIHYNRQEVFTLRFLTHAEYNKNRWKSSL